MAPDDVLRSLFQQLASAIAAELSGGHSNDLELLEIPQLAEETGLSPDYLKAQCRKYEAGNPHGLKCTRKEPGVKNSTLLVGRDWFAEWREGMAERNQDGGLPPELAQRLARSRQERVSTKRQAAR